jgi:biotin carboxyl carrier protein
MAIYQVTVKGKNYQVEIEDLTTQPVRAVVDGQIVEVWIGERELKAVTPRPSPAQAAPASRPVVAAPPRMTSPQAGLGSDTEIRAPMPGSIVSVAVQPGDQVQVGQDLCVLEAMKMNNRLRAPRTGTIAEVRIQPGQQVQHGDVLMAYSE